MASLRGVTIAPTKRENGLACAVTKFAMILRTSTAAAPAMGPLARDAFSVMFTATQTVIGAVERLAHAMRW